MISKLLYYESKSFDPYENLAIEKYLLDNCPADSLLLYLWQNDNTVVIGKNQNPWTECKCKELEADGGHLARRLSGGGAVFHDKGNLNFTFISATENHDVSRNLEIIKNACQYADVNVEISGRNDMLADGKKFSGNAFYNSHGKSYHHGTLLIDSDFEKMAKYLTPSKAKLEAKGIKSVRSRTVNLIDLSPDLTISKMKTNMLKATEDHFGLNVTKIKIEDPKAVGLLSVEYASSEWLYGSSLPFTAQFKEHFDWGNIELMLDVKKGVVCSVQTYTDSIDESLPDQLSDALTSCHFNKEEITKKLSENLSSSISKDIISMIKSYEI